jgi:hypothetical protein
LNISDWHRRRTRTRARSLLETASPPRTSSILVQRWQALIRRHGDFPLGFWPLPAPPITSYATMEPPAFKPCQPLTKWYQLTLRGPGRIHSRTITSPCCISSLSSSSCSWNLGYDVSNQQLSSVRRSALRVRSLKITFTTVGMKVVPSILPDHAVTTARHD